LRRRLGAPPELFSPIDVQSLQPSWRLRKSRPKLLQLLLQLGEIEAGLTDYLRHDINRVLERRINPKSAPQA